MLGVDGELGVGSDFSPWVGSQNPNFHQSRRFGAQHGSQTSADLPLRDVRQEGDAERLTARAEAKRNEAINKLQRVIEQMEEGPRKAELLFRLSEMLWAKVRYRRLQAMARWETRLDAWEAQGAEGPEPRLRDLPEYSASEEQRLEAVALYERILKRYPDYPRQDEVLYNLADSLYDTGQKRRSIELFRRLITNFPKSSHVPDAWLQLGEHYFNANKLAMAIEAYSQAAQPRKARVYSYALYKLAWCDYNLGEYAAALDKFRQVVSYARDSHAEGFGEVDRIQLHDEALFDMVLVYAHLDAVEDAAEYFRAEVGAERAHDYLSRLASVYQEQGKWQLAIKMSTELNEAYPNGHRAPQNQIVIINAYAKAGKKERMRQEVRRLIEVYAPEGAWSRQNAGNVKVLETAFDAIEEELARLVTEQHAAAQKTKLVEDYELARDLYENYLRKFGHSNNSHKFRFFYAEILFELKSFKEAARQYDLILVESPEGEFSEHASFGAVLSWEKVVNAVQEKVGATIERVRRGRGAGALRDHRDLGPVRPSKKSEARPLSEAEVRLVAACDRFGERYRDGDAAKVAFKAARIFYRRGHFEEAIQRLARLIEQWPRNPLASVAANAILDTAREREAWTELRTWVLRFRKQGVLTADVSFSARLDDLLVGASFNEILHGFEREYEGAPLRVADRYLAYFEQFPKSAYALVALHNAVVHYDKANALERAMTTAVFALAHHKKSTTTGSSLPKIAKLPSAESLLEKLVFLSAAFHERVAQFGRAAQYYERYARDFPKGPRRADALYNAGILRQSLGQPKAALLHFVNCLEMVTGAHDAKQLFWRIGEILEKNKDHKGARQHYSDYARFLGKGGHEILCAQFRAAQASKRLKNREQARTSLEQVVRAFRKLPARFKKKDCVLESVAGAKFDLLQEQHEKYMAIPLRGIREKQMQKNVLRKLKMLKALQRSYLEVLEIGHGGYGVAALYRVGEIYEHLATGLLQSKCPRRLGQDLCAIYLDALQKRALPLEERALEAFEKTLSKAFELKIYNRWLVKAQKALIRLQPGRFPEMPSFALLEAKDGDASSKPLGFSP